MKICPRLSKLVKKIPTVIAMNVTSAETDSLGGD